MGKIAAGKGGKTEAEIKKERLEAIEQLKGRYQAVDSIEILDTHFTDFDGNAVQFLGKSLMEGLAHADLAVFFSGWEQARGCISSNLFYNWLFLL
jgi:hypothetical protein